MEPSATVTLAIVFHNERERLPLLLESLQRRFTKDLLPFFEFLFLDNASIDESCAILMTWMKKNLDFSVNLVRRPENHMAKARTQALQLAETPWVAFVDADSVLEEQWPQMVLKTIEGAPEGTVAIGGQSHYVSEKPWQKWAQALANYFPIGKRPGQRTRVDHVPTNNYLVKRGVALEIGGFHSFFDRVGEDLEFNVRIREKGLIFHDPLFGVSHALPDTEEKWFRKMAFYGRAQSFVWLHHGGGIPWAKFLPLAMVLLSQAALLLWPMVSFVSLTLALLIPRSRFFLLTFLFYGLGEFVGFFQYIYRRTNPESFGGLIHKVP